MLATAMLTHYNIHCEKEQCPSYSKKLWRHCGKVSYKLVVGSSAAAKDQYHQYNNDGCDTQSDDSDYDCDIDSDSSG